jgi:hypothetical protein
VCFGSVNQQISDKGVLAVFEELLGFCHESFVFNINQYYRASISLLVEL